MRHERHWTLAEAQAALPWLAARLERLRAARDRFADEGAREALVEAAPSNGGGKPGRQVGEAFVELQRLLGEFAAREIVLRDLERGLVDFPSLREGREVYLCWEEGEDGIAFWHETDAGHAGRQRL